MAIKRLVVSIVLLSPKLIMIKPLSVEEAKARLNEEPEQKMLILRQMVSNIPQGYERIAQTMSVFLDESELGDSEALELATDRILGFWFKYDSDHPVTF